MFRVPLELQGLPVPEGAKAIILKSVLNADGEISKQFVKAIEARCYYRKEIRLPKETIELLKESLATKLSCVA